MLTLILQWCDLHILREEMLARCLKSLELPFTKLDAVTDGPLRPDDFFRSSGGSNTVA